MNFPASSEPLAVQWRQGTFELSNRSGGNLAEYEGSAEDPSLADFLERVALITDTDLTEGEESGVTFMTLHNAKGLEFPSVFILGMEEGVFPHVRSLGEPEELEEERRLC